MANLTKKYNGFANDLLTFNWTADEDRPVYRLHDAIYNPLARIKYYFAKRTRGKSARGFIAYSLA